MPLATVDDLRRAERILVYGVTGAGKSTAAVRLGEVLELPVHLVDEEIGWLPGWVPRAPEELVSIATRLAAEPRWIFDPAYSSVLAPGKDRSQVIVALDHPRWPSSARLLRRTVRRVVCRTEQCNGNVETWRRVVSRDSILRWHLTSFHRKRERMRAWADDPEGTPVLLVGHPRALEDVLGALISQ